MSKPKLPSLPLEDWEATQITLHLWLQIVGKIKLALMPKLNHWWHITFRVSAKGLTTGPIPHDNGYFTIDFNFVEHKLEFTSSWGFYNYFKLQDGLSVANFYDKIYLFLKEIDLNPEIIGMPYDHPCEEPFAECETHHSYQAGYVRKFYDILIFTDQVFREFKSHFIGKVSPVQLFWHHMDLAVTRFSGSKGPAMSENANEADKEAYSHEVISAGFWAGDENVREPAFYAYAYPSPEGIEKEPLYPKAAYWKDANGSPMAMLMYNDLLKSKNPELDVLNFLKSSYAAGAKLGGWSEDLVTLHPEKHD